MSSHLTMVSWLSHLSVVTLLHLTRVMSHSVHSAESLLVSWVDWGHSALHLSPLLSLHCLLLGLDVLLSLFLALVEHVADLAKMVDLGVAGVELVVLVGALDHLVPSLLLSHLGSLGVFALLLALLALVGLRLLSLLGILLVCTLVVLLLLGLLLLLSWLVLGELLRSANLSKDIDDDIGLRLAWLNVLILGIASRAQLSERVSFLHIFLVYLSAGWWISHELDGINDGVRDWVATLWRWNLLFLLKLSPRWW